MILANRGWSQEEGSPDREEAYERDGLSALMEK